MSTNELNGKIKLFFNKIKDQFTTLTKGEYNFGVMLYVFGLAPAVIISLLFQRKIDFMHNIPLRTIIYVILVLYFSWHIYVIRKSLKAQPEYRVVKQSKKELYEGKTEEEIEAIKKEKRKERFQKFLLLKAWDTTPNYILIGCVDIYVILTQLQGLLYVIK